jgi:hypothetical protein
MSQELPAQIQRELDEAEAIEKAIAEEQATLANPTDTDKPEAVAEVAAEAAVVPEPKPKAQPDAEEETYKARFTTLQGKFNAEVPRLHQQLKDSNASMEVMRKQIELLSQQAPVAVEAQTVTSEDEEAFGSDLLAVMKKVAKQEAAVVAKQQDAKVQTVASKVADFEKTQAATAGDKFMESIAKAVPDWETVNADPKWLDWLDEYSPETGAPRQAALDDASSKLDSARTIALFNLYKKQAQPDPVAATTETLTKAQQELQRQVAPAKSAAAAAKPVTDRTWTGDEYERAFDIRNSQTMSAAEIDALQADAERAYADGRVRW